MGVAKHNTDKDCWVIVNGEVLDVTKFLPDHPGGALAILTFAGKDATEEFNMIHPPAVIGKLAAGGEPVAAAAGASPAKVTNSFLSLTLAQVVEKLCCARPGYYK